MVISIGGEQVELRITFEYLDLQRLVLFEGSGQDNDMAPGI